MERKAKIWKGKKSKEMEKKLKQKNGKIWNGKKRKEMERKARI